MMTVKKQPKTLPALACPACGCRHLPVYRTQQRPGYIVRQRICRHCGRRIITRETIGVQKR